MTLASFALYGLLTTGAVTVLGFISLFVYGHMQRADMDPEEVGHRMVRGWMGPGYAIKSWFKGLAKGMSWSAEIATYDIILLLKRREWRKAVPFAVVCVGALGVFFFMPLWVISYEEQLHPILKVAFALIFFVQAMRAAWPRRSTSDILRMEGK